MKNNLFTQWLHSLDPVRRKTTTTFTSTCIVAVIGFGGMAIMTFVPGVQSFFSFDISASATLFIVYLCFVTLFGYLESNDKLTLPQYGYFSMTGMGLFQLYMWSLVSYSQLPGAAVMAAFPILLTSFHGSLYHSSIQFPFPLIVSVIAVSVGFFLNVTPEHCSIFFVAAPVALGANLLLGMFTTKDFKTRKDQEQLRAAVDAQLLAERSKHLKHMSNLLYALSGQHHDAGNVVSGLMLNLPFFIKLIDQSNVDNSKLSQARNLAKQISESLQRLHDMLHESRQIYRSEGVKIAQVVPFKITEKVVEASQTSYPNIPVTLDCEPSIQNKSITFIGGELALYRIIMNIVLNSCEGNEKIVCTEILIIISSTNSSHNLTIKVIDNGPGFPMQLINQPIDAFQTTKSHGTGLGMYTAQRILVANSGYITRENRKDTTGAMVTIYLGTGEPV